MVAQFSALGSNKASLPGGVELEQLGARSQPGRATQTCPLLSNAVPQGLPPGTEYSVILLILDASAACALVGIVVHAMKRALTATTATIIRKTMILLI